MGSILTGCRCDVGEYCIDACFLPAQIMVRNVIPFLEPKEVLCTVCYTCRSWQLLIRNARSVWMSSSFIDRLCKANTRNLILEVASCPSKAHLVTSAGCAQDLARQSLVKKADGVELSCCRLLNWLGTTGKSFPELRIWINLVRFESIDPISLWAATSHFSERNVIATDRLMELRVNDTDVVCFVVLFC